MKRLFLALLVSFAALVAVTPTANAAEEWCDTDPLVLIQTPGGALVAVYVTNGALGVEHLPAAQAATIGYSARPSANGRDTLVEMTVLVPDDLFGSGFPTRSTVSTGPLATGDIYATASGQSGTVMTMTFKLGVP